MMRTFFDASREPSPSSVRRKRDLSKGILRGAPVPRDLGSGLHSFGAQISAALLAREARKEEERGREAFLDDLGSFTGVDPGARVTKAILRSPMRAPAIESSPLPEAPEPAAVASSSLSDLGIVDMANPSFHYGRTASAQAAPFKGLVFHHTADKPLEDLVRYGQTVDEERGGAFGYHYYVGRDGRIVQGAPLDKRTNHVKGPSHSARIGGGQLSNSDALGITLVGAADGETPEQLAAAERLGRALMAEYGIGPDSVFGHGDMQSDRRSSEGAVIVNALKGDQGGVAQPVDDQAVGIMQSPQAQRTRFDPELLRLMGNEFATPAERTVLSALMQQQLQQMQPPEPITPFQQAQLGLSQQRLSSENERLDLARQNAARSQGNADRDYALRQQEAARQGGQFDRTHGLAQQRHALDVARHENRAPSALEQRIALMTEAGIDEMTARKIATGVITTSRDPLTGAGRSLDLSQPSGSQPLNATQEQAQVEPDQQSPEAPINLYDLSEDVTGVGPSLEALSTDTLGQIPGIGPMFSFPDTVEKRQVVTAAVNEMIRSAAVNVRLPVAEVQRLLRDFGVKPGVLLSAEGLRARMRGLDAYFRNRLANTEAVAADANAPIQQRREASASATYIRNYLSILGVDENAASQSPNPEDLPRIRNDAEFEALPSGTAFIGPDGKARVKP